MEDQVGAGRAWWVRVAAIAASFAVLCGVAWGLSRVIRPLQSWDLRAVHTVAGSRTPLLIHAAHIVSACGRGWVALGVAAVVAVVTVLRRLPRPWLPLLVVGLAILLQDITKVLADRPRPPAGLRLEHVGSLSFPSGHALEATALCGVLLVTLWPALTTRRWRIVAACLAIGWVLAICAARLTLGVHYPTDVGAGVLLGGLLAAAVSVIWGRGTRPPSPRDVPCRPGGPDPGAAQARPGGTLRCRQR